MWYSKLHKYYLKRRKMSERILDTHAIEIIGMIPESVTPGTSSSATFTTMSVITNENTHSVMSRIGNVINRKNVPSIRFTSHKITAKTRIEIYPFDVSIPGIVPDCDKK